MRALIAFDLDGVLYSSEPFLGEAYREAIARVNAQHPGAFPRVPTTREILDHVGWPVPVILSRLFPHIDAAAVRLLSAESLPVICAHVAAGEGRVFPHVPATLARLREQGYTLAVASNGRRLYLETVLITHGLAAYFTDLVTIDTIDGGTKADVLRTLLAQLRFDPSELLMVGDRASDVEAAVAVGCRFVGCDYGHGHRHEIAGAGPIVSRFEELPQAISAAFT